MSRDETNARFLTSADADVNTDVKAELKNHAELRGCGCEYVRSSIPSLLRTIMRQFIIQSINGAYGTNVFYAVEIFMSAWCM